jgi:hypothetical protein
MKIAAAAVQSAAFVARDVSKKVLIFGIASCFAVQSAWLPTSAWAQSRSPAGIAPASSEAQCSAVVCDQIETMLQAAKSATTLGALLSAVSPQLGKEGKALERRARAHRQARLAIEPTAKATWTYTASGQVFRVAILADESGFMYSVNDKTFKLAEGDNLKTIEKQIATVLPTSLSKADGHQLLLLLMPEARAFWMMALGIIALIGGGWLLWNEAKKAGGREERRRQSAEQ